MSKPEYDALVDAVAAGITQSTPYYPRDNARAILALIHERLSKPTDAMVEAWAKAYPPPLASLNPFSPITDAKVKRAFAVNRAFATSDLNAMLNASALTPGDKS